MENDQLILVPVDPDSFEFSHSIRQAKDVAQPCFSFHGKAVMAVPIGEAGCGIVRVACAVVGEEKRLAHTLANVAKQGQRSLVVSALVNIKDHSNSKIDLRRTWPGYCVETSISQRSWAPSLAMTDAKVTVFTVDFFTTDVSAVRVDGRGHRTEGKGWKSEISEQAKPDTLKETAVPFEVLAMSAETCEPIRGISGTQQLLEEAGFKGGHLRKKKRRQIRL